MGSESVTSEASPAFNIKQPSDRILHVNVELDDEPVLLFDNTVQEDKGNESTFIQKEMVESERFQKLKSRVVKIVSTEEYSFVSV